MSSDTLLPINSVTVPPQFDRLTDTGRDAVDVLEVATRLESLGMSDRTVQVRHHEENVFVFAQKLLHHRAFQPRVQPQPALSRRELRTASQRSAVLILGALLAAFAQVALLAPAWSVAIAGVAAWLSGQAVAGLAWSRRGALEHTEALRRGGGLIVIATTTAASLGLVAIAASYQFQGTGAGHRLVIVTAVFTVGAILYGAFVSLLVIAEAANRLLRFMMPILGLSLALILLTSPQHTRRIAATGAVLVVAMVVITAATVIKRAGGARLPTRRDVLACWPTLLQAALLSASLLSILKMIDPRSATALVIASLIGSAVADPAIVVLRHRLRISSARSFHVRIAARAARRAAMMAAIATGLVSASVTVIVVLLVLAPDQMLIANTALAAGAFTAMATTSASLTAFGSPWQAVLVSALAATASLIWLNAQVAGAWVAAPIGVVLALLILRRRVSDPRVSA